MVSFAFLSISKFLFGVWHFDNLFLILDCYGERERARWKLIGLLNIFHCLFNVATTLKTDRNIFNVTEHGQTSKNRKKMYYFGTLNILSWKVINNTLTAILTKEINLEKCFSLSCTNFYLKRSIRWIYFETLTYLNY